MTTAATLWYATVIGLCLGGGQIELGLAATTIGLCALWGLKWAGRRMRQERRASLSIEFEAGTLREDAIRRALSDAGRRIVASEVSMREAGRHRELMLDLSELRYPGDTETPGFCEAFAKEPRRCQAALARAGRKLKPQH